MTSRMFNGWLYEFWAASWGKNAQEELRDLMKEVNPERKYRITPIRANYRIIGYRLWVKKE